MEGIMASFSEVFYLLDVTEQELHLAKLIGDEHGVQIALNAHQRAIEELLDYADHPLPSDTGGTAIDDLVADLKGVA